MKPNGPVARRDDYTFDAAPKHRDAAELIRAEHYAKGWNRLASEMRAMGLTRVRSRKLRFVKRRGWNELSRKPLDKR